MNNFLEKYKEEIRSKVFTGTDAKQLQYEEYAVNLCYNKIDLNKILTDKISSQIYDSNNPNNSNCIVINLEKDAVRYKSIVYELQKIGMNGFVHLKATYWKEKNNMKNNLEFVINFLKKFQPNYNNSNNNEIKLEMNEFSEFNDPNIYIQDGPLACYCSHVRGLIYGYTTFNNYTIIIEDDAFVSNTINIEKYIKEIPDDWDIILLNSVPLHKKYEDIYYKLENTFHSLHFYIIKNSVLPIIFENIYPIYDQIDVLIAKLYNRLNIYNITDSVYQKNFATNTQNNLNAILNSPGYHGIRNYLDNIKKYLLEYLECRLKDNSERNNKIADQIFFDVIYNFIVNNFTYESSNYYNDTRSENSVDVNFRLIENEDTHIDEINNIENNSSYIKMYHDIYIVINNCMKGKNVHHHTLSLLSDIKQIIDCFDLHKLNNNNYKACSYGASANTYLAEEGKVIVKVYNKKLRWHHKEHNDIDSIFNKEVEILKKLSLPTTSISRIPYLIEVDNDMKMIKIPFLGISLFDNFSLPLDWKEQMIEVFGLLTNRGIEYPEFNLKNILVMDDKISLVDFGLARFSYTENNLDIKKLNDKHLKVFIEILEKLKQKFETIEQKHITVLYQTFLNNMKIENKYTDNIF